MASRESKKSSLLHLHQQLQLLRSITNSTAVNRSSIIIDASNYIQQLKHKIEKLNHDIHLADHHQQSSSSSSSTHQNNNNNVNDGLPMVTVETLEKEKQGFSINIFSSKNSPGLLVTVLEAFEELGLNVVEARVSCSDDSFRLQAVGGGGRGGDHRNEEDEQSSSSIIDPQVIKEAVLQAINGWDG